MLTLLWNERQAWNWIEDRATTIVGSDKMTPQVCFNDNFIFYDFDS